MSPQSGGLPTGDPAPGIVRCVVQHRTGREPGHEHQAQPQKRGQRDRQDVGIGACNRHGLDRCSHLFSSPVTPDRIVGYNAAKLLFHGARPVSWLAGRCVLSPSRFPNILVN
jgi:hypothetical protein